MGDLIKGIQSTPIPTILIVVGLLILVLAFVTKIGGMIEVSPEQRKWAIPVGLFVLIIGLVLNSASVPSPPTPIPVSLPPKAKNTSCEAQLSDKLGRYEGKAVITNSSTRRSGKIVIDVIRETDTSCRLIARVEEFPGLAGKGILTGNFDPSVGQKVDLTGTLNHQTEPKVWDVEMKVQFINQNIIEGQSTWKPKSGVEDTKTYYEDFTATKPS